MALITHKQMEKLAEKVVQSKAADQLANDLRQSSHLAATVYRQLFTNEEWEILLDLTGKVKGWLREVQQVNLNVDRGNGDITFLTLDTETPLSVPYYLLERSLVGSHRVLVDVKAKPDDPARAHLIGELLQFRRDHNHLMNAVQGIRLEVFHNCRVARTPARLMKAHPEYRNFMREILEE